MSDWSFHAAGSAWWPYLFILAAGWLPTDIWRYLGVLSSGSISENSPAIQLVRAIATALVAAVIARLVLYPTGSMALVPDAFRIAAMAAGFAVYLVSRRSIVLGIVAAQIVFFAGAFASGAL